MSKQMREKKQQIENDKIDTTPHDTVRCRAFTTRAERATDA